MSRNKPKNRAILLAAALSLIAAAANSANPQSTSGPIANTVRPAAMILDPKQCRATQAVKGISNGQTLHCEPGARLLIEGISNTARVTGNCAAICIRGTDNVITIDGDALAVAVRGSTNEIRAMRVDAVSLRGMNNSVWYQTSLGGIGPNKDQPKAAIRGIHNSIKWTE